MRRNNGIATFWSCQADIVIAAVAVDNLAGMPEFITLPSGLILNLRLITQITAKVEHGTTSLAVHFSAGDVAILMSEDAKVLRERLGASSGLSSGIKAGIFWAVIVTAVALIYFAMRR